MAKCKGCGATIIWIWTAGGKHIPCDPEQVVYWQRPKGQGRIVTPNGEVISCEYKCSGGTDSFTGVGYVPHWSTCPAAERFRKKKGA